jgi:hypothetical protein
MNATTTPKTAPAPNGRRPALSDSIDRLDRILDGLSEAIPATIRDALREGVAAAVAEGVRAALVEVLSGEVLHGLLRGTLPAAPAPTSAPKPSLGSRLLTKARSVCATVRAWVGGMVQRVAAGLATVGRKMREGLTTTFCWLGWGWRWVRLLPVVATVGGAAAVCALAVSGWWRSIQGGVAAVWTNLAALTRRLFQRLPCPFLALAP